MFSLSCYNAVKRTDRTTDYSTKGLINKTSARFQTDIENDRPLCLAPYVLSVFVGDRSGSMAAMGSVPAEGAMEFVSKYKNLAEKNTGSSVGVTVVTFDDRADTMNFSDAKQITHIDARRVGERMIPRGTTRLYDTAIEAIIEQQSKYMEIKKKIKKMPYEIRNLDPHVAMMFTLLTDGEDNMSHYNSKDLAQHLSDHKKLYGAQCFFAAANQDALYAGQKYGFDEGNTLQIGNDIEEARMAFRSCTNASMRAATGHECSYTQAEREASCSYNEDYNYSDDEFVGTPTRPMRY